MSRGIAVRKSNWRRALVAVLVFWCAAANATVIQSLTLRIDSTRSFVEAIHNPLQFGFDPDQLIHGSYGISGLIELELREPDLFSAANAFIRPVEVHTGVPYRPFGFITGLGIVDSLGVMFTENPCYFAPPGLCGTMAGIYWGSAEGVFDGTELFLRGYDRTELVFQGPTTQYVFTIFANVVDPNAVAEPPLSSIVMAALLTLAVIRQWPALKRKGQRD